MGHHITRLCHAIGLVSGFSRQRNSPEQVGSTAANQCSGAGRGLTPVRRPSTLSPSWAVKRPYPPDEAPRRSSNVALSYVSHVSHGATPTIRLFRTYIANLRRPFVIDFSFARIEAREEK